MNKKLNICNNIIHNNNINITNLNELNNDILLKKYEDLINNEPNKLFKKKHNKWQVEVEKLKKEIDQSFNNLYKDYNDIEKTM